MPFETILSLFLSQEYRLEDINLKQYFAFISLAIRINHI